MTSIQKIFISYRRADNEIFVQGIRNWMIHKYGRENVFMDFDGLRAFTDFQAFIEKKIAEADAVIVIIGPDWLKLLKEKSANFEADYVRFEIETAFAQKKLIAPLCVLDAKMPRPAELPESLRPLCRIHAPILNPGDHFLDHIDEIIDDLELAFGEWVPPAPPISVPIPTPTREEYAEAPRDKNTDYPAPPIKGAASLLGTHLKDGRYTLVRVIATGGMARIYEAVDHFLERTVAVKVLIPDPDRTEDDDTLMMRFKREASTVAQLNHPNIIQVYDYGEEPSGIYFFVMNLVRGKDLGQELSRLRRAGSRMYIDRAFRIMEQVAAALDEAHRMGIIHRDIKPSNILLDNEDRVTLTDFGLLLRPTTDSTFGTPFGTPHYISPEQAMASNQVTPQSDIYSLAVVFYEILTGKSPFNGETPIEIAIAHIYELPPSPSLLNPEIPEAVEVELLKALDKQPQNRHQNAASFVYSMRRAYGMQIDDGPPAVG